MDELNGQNVTMHIVCAADANYGAHAGITFSSVLKANVGEQIHLHLFPMASLRRTSGKAILIASAMSILERVLFPARPTYFVTAGLRGGGKTTTLAMIIYAVTGVKPSARAWTSNVDERRKSLLAILSAGMPAVVWDNVPRGTAINCQYIEAASTTEVYQDRILGVTEDRFAPAYTIMFFTGNNIHPHEDQASRSLEVSLDTDRPDPENRDFKHPDPMGWTRDHRGQILGALYTILTGNPRRSGPQETRFKDWMALVGTAVEYAAELADERLADE